MSKKPLVAVGSLVAAALMIGASFSLTGCSGSRSASTDSGATSSSASAPSSSGSGSTTQASTGTAAPSTSATDPTSPGYDASKVSSYVSPLTAAGLLRALPPMVSPDVAARKITSPIGKGQAISPMSGPAHKETLSGLALSSMPANSAYTIKLRPYGFGPSFLYGTRYVIFVESATPVDKAPKSVVSKLAKHDVLALIDINNNGGLMSGGGLYTATLHFYSDGEKLIPTLSDAKYAQ